MSFQVLIAFLIVIVLSLGESKVIPLPKGIGVEGVTTGKGNLFFVADITTGDIVVIDSQSGLVIKNIRNEEKNPSLGLDYDNGKYIYVSGAGRGFQAIAGPLLNRTIVEKDATLYVYDIEMSKLYKSCKVPGASLLNDIKVDPTNTYAYATDSFGSFIYQLSIKDLPSCKINKIPLPDTFGQPGVIGANGIEVFKRGLIVAHFGEGSLYFIDLQRNNAWKRLTPKNLMPGADGIQLIPDKRNPLLLVVASNQISVLKLSFKPFKRIVTAVRNRIIKRATFADIATVAVDPRKTTIMVTNLNQSARAIGGQLSVTTLRYKL